VVGWWYKEMALRLPGIGFDVGVQIDLFVKSKAGEIDRRIGERFLSPQPIGGARVDGLQRVARGN